ncbi:MAG TPA: aspartate aminotransferase family protein [Candidatus Polarisedimenticolia bacterium]|nr:aspartate aminotransferase family protein [Candidatus Polarisedimenticolia bacterium]
MPDRETDGKATTGQVATDAASKHQRFLFPCVTTYYDKPLTIVRGQGMHLFDETGKQYLDCFGGVLTVSVGHCHPEITEAIVRQVQTLVHTSTLYVTPALSDLAEAVAQVLPGDLDRLFFSNSGTEADETAVLLARVHTGNQEVLVLRYGYSGRSMMALAAAGQAPWRQIGTQVPGFVHAVAPYCYRCPLKLTYPSCEVACAKDVEEVIQTTTSGRVAGILAEVVIGSGGFIVPPKEYFEIVAGLVRKAGGLFIADEVQTGWGRTGKMFGIEHYGVTPDVMTFAKGMANGSPIGCTATTGKIAAALRPLSFATFGGNPVTSAAALATLRVIQKQKLADNARLQGDHLHAGLLELQRKYPIIGDVRGIGLMQGAELVGPGKTPDPKAVSAVLEGTRRRGVLIGKGGLWGNVLRVAPPMTISRTEVDELLTALDGAFAEATGKPGRA